MFIDTSSKPKPAEPVSNPDLVYDQDEEVEVIEEDEEIDVDYAAELIEYPS